MMHSVPCYNLFSLPEANKGHIWIQLEEKETESADLRGGAGDDGGGCRRWRLGCVDMK